MKPCISLNTATLITGISRRTLWRHVANSLLQKLHTPSGQSAQVVLADVLKLGEITFTERETADLLAADKGDARAQNAMGIFFHRRKNHAAAYAWFDKAARQSHADALQWLAIYHAAGHQGGEPDEAAALDYLEAAARAGHSIAQAQLETLRAGE